ncbi:MAG: hypothetical protein WDN45_02720 [Caulobacteraceae bacterium]
MLAPQMETALNANWDADLQPGERVAVVGAGVIGLLTRLCRGQDRAGRGDRRQSGAGAPRPNIWASGSRRPPTRPRTAAPCSTPRRRSRALNLSLGLCAFEGQVVELSWFGDKRPAVDLGGAFHSQRLTLKASQVGAVSPSRAGAVRLFQASDRSPVPLRRSAAGRLSSVGNTLHGPAVPHGRDPVEPRHPLSSDPL